MWIQPLTAALAAILSSLLTIFLTPTLQHYLWTYQRRAELRLAAINEFNRLTNDVIACELYRLPPPGAEWFAKLNTASATIEILFSPQAYAAVEATDKLLKPGVSLQGAKDFVRVRDAALRALYSEVIPLP